MHVIILLLVTYLAAMDNIETLAISGKELEDKLSQQQPAQITFNNAIHLSLPIYFVKYYKIPFLKNALQFSEDIDLLKKNIDNLHTTETCTSSYVFVSQGFFKNYPQHFSCVHDMRHFIVDKRKSYRETNNIKKLFCNKLFWINKQLALQQGAQDHLYLVNLHNDTNTFSCNKIDISDYIQDYGQHPLHWNQFYILRSSARFSEDHELLNTQIENDTVHVLSKKKISHEVYLPLLIALPECNMSLVMSPLNTFYILGKKSYRNNGTHITLNLDEGIKRLAYVNKAVQKDFIKAVMNKKISIGQRDCFFANHHLRRNFLDHWISYNIKKIEKE